MNNEILNRWNNTVTNEDIVYYLGDLSLKDPYLWLKQLNGNIVLIRGNHDTHLKRTVTSKIITYDGEKLLLIHAPYWIDREWDGWIIHGHHHNNEMVNFPHYNPTKKMFNVSAELINYTPVELGKLLSMRSNNE
jgi:calcineurin-like phosphoesterase family protein